MATIDEKLIKRLGNASTMRMLHDISYINGYNFALNILKSVEQWIETTYMDKDKQNHEKLKHIYENIAKDFKVAVMTQTDMIHHVNNLFGVEVYWDDDQNMFTVRDDEGRHGTSGSDAEVQDQQEGVEGSGGQIPDDSSST